MLLARSLGEALILIMKSRRWSQTRLARELDVSQPWVSDIVHGKCDCPLNKAASLLDKVGWELHITPKSDKGDVEDDPVKRREFVAGAASALLISPPKTTPFHDPSFVEDLTRRSAHAYYQVGGNSLASTLVRQARKVRSASASGGRALQSAASDFMRQGTWILRQAGHPDLAIRFGNSALQLAEQAGDPDKQALAYSALGYMSIVPDNHSYYLSRTRNDTNGRESTPGAAKRNTGQAVACARRGLDLPDINDESRAFLTTLLARSWANVPGQERQARTEVNRALNIDTLPPVDQGDILGLAGNALRDVGERREALKMLEDAVHLCASPSSYLSARYLGDQIMIVLDMRDPSRAASLMNALSHIVPLVDSTVLDRQVGQILQVTKPWSAVREIREARERLQSVRLSNDGQG